MNNQRPQIPTELPVMTHLPFFKKNLLFYVFPKNVTQHYYMLL